jgi:hypothetical protein
MNFSLEINNSEIYNVNNMERSEVQLMMPLWYSCLTDICSLQITDSAIFSESCK